MPGIARSFDPVLRPKTIQLLHARRERRAEALTAPPADRVFDIRNGLRIDSPGEIENEFRIGNRTENFYDVTVAHIRRHVIDNGILKDCVLATGQETATQQGLVKCDRYRNEYVHAVIPGRSNVLPMLKHRVIQSLFSYQKSGRFKYLRKITRDIW
jgi:hypothetical protein